MSHGAGRVVLRDLGEFLLRLVIPEGMQQRDAAFKRFLDRSRARNREMHRPQLFRSQIFVVMAFIGQRQNSEQRHLLQPRAGQRVSWQGSIASESRPAMMEGSIREEG